MGFNIPSNFVGSWALNAQRTGQIHKAKLCSKSPVTTWTEGIGNFLLALLNFFFPNLEMILTLRWFYSVVHIYLCLLETLLYLGDSWRSKSRLKNTTDFFFSVQRRKYTFFPIWQILFDATSPPLDINSYNRDLLHCQTQQGKNVQRINGRLFIRYNCLLIRRESSFPFVTLS